MIPGDAYCEPCCPQSELTVPCSPAPQPSDDDSYDESFGEFAWGMAKAANEALDEHGVDSIAADTLLGVRADGIAPKKSSREESDEDIDGLSDGELEEVHAPPAPVP